MTNAYLASSGAICQSTRSARSWRPAGAAPRTGRSCAGPPGEFDVPLTVDTNVEHQQNMAAPPIAVLVLVAFNNDVAFLCDAMLAPETSAQQPVPVPAEASFGFRVGSGGTYVNRVGAALDMVLGIRLRDTPAGMLIASSRPVSARSNKRMSATA